MRKHYKKAFVLLLMVSMLLSSTTAMAARLGTGKISGGAQNILYWRDSSIYEYKESVDYGIQYWNGISSQVSVNRTTTQSYSKCDVYWGNYLPGNYDTPGMTELILNNQVLTSFDADWYWSRIKMNQNKFNYDNMTYDERKGSICHEYGHFLGMGHVSVYYSIMCTLECGRLVQTPSTFDTNELIAIYGS
jgi:hypothetical protein